MKKVNVKYMFLIVLLFVAINTKAQVGIGTTAPDASAMLDIQSPDNNKGVLVPRMTSALRTAIPSPANGLLVFDTETKSFWYYNVDAWKELVGEGTLADADNDTKIEVEKNLDEDIVRFTTAGTEYMQINPNGDIKLGNRGGSTLTGGSKNSIESDNIGEQNYTKIRADGSLSYVGNATRWEDLKVPVNAVKIKDKTDPLDEPKWDNFIGGTALLWFEHNKGDDVVFTVQMPHAWKEGTAIMPHVHWTTGRDGDSAPGAARVTWGLEYYWANAGDVFPTTTVAITGNTAPTSDGTIKLREHVITPLGAISGTGNHNLSSMLVCRLYRVNVGYTGDAGLLEIDFHYQVDSDGSNQEYTKE